MKYTAEKKRAILLYILEKIAQGVKGLSSVVAEALEISANTVHAYLKELQADGIIEKHQRGEYSLKTIHEEYTFKRSLGELYTDTVAYDVCLEKKIKHLPENIKHIWAYAISEMVNNVIDHSDGETMKVIVEQNYLTTSVRIIDDGVGIFEKIRSHFSFASIDEAICELFKGKLTTDEANHSGEGIFFTSRMMDSFYIVSDGKIFSTNRFDNDIILDEGENKKGTSVYMTLSNLTSRTAREIFDQYSSVDGGFTTTRIPLKNIFDTAPVSRSQAKRICNRLENFKEVIIDFDGISWIGQGFAHQIFVVFKNAHPDISITPIKMNESVEGMYLHVIKTV